MGPELDPDLSQMIGPLTGLPDGGAGATTLGDVGHRLAPIRSAYLAVVPAGARAEREPAISQLHHHVTPVGWESSHPDAAAGRDASRQVGLVYPLGEKAGAVVLDGRGEAGGLQQFEPLVVGVDGLLPVVDDGPVGLYALRDAVDVDEQV